MLEIKIKDKSYDIPSDWSEITLQYWCGLYEIIKKYSKKETVEERVDEEFNELDLLRMNREMFMYVTGVSEKEMDTLEMDSVNEALQIIGGLLEDYQPKGIESFESNGKFYYFPKEYLKKSTYGDYIEATQLDMTIEYMKHGRFDVLPEQMAILCREIGEEFDDELVIKKTEEFKELKMDTVWEFGFFLSRQSLILAKTFQMFSGEVEVAEKVA
tara:strand:- start:1021 stop:1662 length:642 start_codon:yes stop_codon:yes gene_type:complete